MTGLWCDPPGQSAALITPLTNLPELFFSTSATRKQLAFQCKLACLTSGFRLQPQELAFGTLQGKCLWQCASSSCYFNFMASPGPLELLRLLRS